MYLPGLLNKAAGSAFAFKRNVLRLRAVFRLPVSGTRHGIQTDVFLTGDGKSVRNPVSAALFCAYAAWVLSPSSPQVCKCMYEI